MRVILCLYRNVFQALFICHAYFFAPLSVWEQIILFIYQQLTFATLFTCFIACFYFTHIRIVSSFDSYDKTTRISRNFFYPRHRFRTVNAAAHEIFKVSAEKYTRSSCSIISVSIFTIKYANRSHSCIANLRGSCRCRVRFKVQWKFPADYFYNFSRGFSERFCDFWQRFAWSVFVC